MQCFSSVNKPQCPLAKWRRRKKINSITSTNKTYMPTSNSKEMRTWKKKTGFTELFFIKQTCLLYDYHNFQAGLWPYNRTSRIINIYFPMADLQKFTELPARLGTKPADSLLQFSVTTLPLWGTLQLSSHQQNRWEHFLFQQRKSAYSALVSTESKGSL